MEQPKSFVSVPAKEAASGLGIFFAALVLQGCATSSACSPGFPVNVPTQELPLTVSSVPVQVRRCPEGFQTVAPIILRETVVVPAGAQVRAVRAYPQTLPPRYIVDALRLGDKSHYTPVTGTVIFAEGRYVLTLSGGRVEIPKARKVPKHRRSRK